MKIERITPFLVDRFLLVRVYTDEGLIGNGEAGLWAHHEVVYSAIQSLSDYYVGKDPLRIEHHYQTVSRYTHFMGAVLSAALSGIDMALWDILGKATGQPVHQLLGGKVRDKVKTFANANGPSVQACADAARQAVEAGYLSLRTMPFFPGWEQKTDSQIIDMVVKSVAAIREAVGYEIDLGVECHRNFAPNIAIALAHELEPFRLVYYEDPVAPESNEGLAIAARQIKLPIATGERFYNIYQFKDLIDRGCVTLIRPDVSLAGGYTQCKKIAGMAEAAFVGIFPHLMGSPLNIAAFVQFDAAIPNFVLHENLTSADAFNDLLDQPVERQGGWLIVPDRPGIGVEINEAALAKYPYKPIKFHGFFQADGAVAH
jgi:galactonate dehydratase